MARQIEIEFKNMVTKAEFNLLLQTFKIVDSHFFSQKNHYFDTEDFSLKQMGTALRVRELPNSYELTLKRKDKIGMIEVNQLLHNKEAAALLAAKGAFPSGEVYDEIQKMNICIEDLVLFGTLTTNRAETEYEKGLLVFDHSFYLEKEDFEIEYEVVDFGSGQVIFYNLMEMFNIKVRAADHKIGRLYKAKKEL